MLLYIGIAVVVLIAVFLGVLIYRFEHGSRQETRDREALWAKHQEEGRRAAARLEELVSRANTGGEEAISKLRQGWNSLTEPVQKAIGDTLRQQVEGILKKHDDDKAYATTISKLEAEQQKLQDETAELGGRVQAGVELLSSLSLCGTAISKRYEQEHRVTSATFNEQLRELVRAYYNELVSCAEGDRQAFLALRELVWRTRVNSLKIPYDLWDLRVPELPYPDNWNRWTAEYIYDPSCAEFVGLRYGYEPGASMVRNEAAEAIEEQDLTGIMVALAYCKASSHTREVVGDYLTGRLALAAAELRKTLQFN